MSKPVLLVIDMQSGLFDDEASQARAKEVSARINTLSAAVRTRGGQVIFIRHSEADGLEEGSAAWQIVPELLQDAADAYVEKTACDAFLGTPLKAMLDAAGASPLLIAGCATDFCVDTTLRAAASLGYPVRVASDAHLTTTDRPYANVATIIQHHNFVWQRLAVPGNPVHVATTAALCSDL
jgi:nicotinamidase-related amidase